MADTTKPAVPAGTQAAQRATTSPSPEVEAAKKRIADEQTRRQEQQKADAELAKKAADPDASPEDRAKAQVEINRASATRDNLQATGSPSGTVSAKENQPVALPVDTGSEEMAEPQAGATEQTPHDAGVLTTHAHDKNADLPYQGTPVRPAPTQDPPINVGARVPVGSARVDLTRTIGGGALAGEALQGVPGGHLGALPGSEGVIPEPVQQNPPVRPRGGTVEAAPQARAGQPTTRA